MENPKVIFTRDIHFELLEPDSNGTFWTKSIFDDRDHRMVLRLQIDPGKREIIDARAQMLRIPYTVCEHALRKIRNLIGLRIEKGAMREIPRRVGGPDSCVHLRELAMETANFVAGALIGHETGYGIFGRQWNELSEEERLEKSFPMLENVCYPYARNAKDERRIAK